jgi:hypothetical protein
MKIRSIAVIACLLPLLSCDKEKPAAAKPSDITEGYLKAADIPILPLRVGDSWKYKITVEVPEGVTSEGSAAIEIDQEKTRVFKGKVFVAEGYPEVDAFDVTVPGQPVERELVEIHEDKILMRGSAYPDSPETQTIWLDTPAPFVLAGLRAGQVVADSSERNQAHQRSIRVVAREKVTVPAGDYDSIRLLMTGNDGQFEVRRTTWFVPRVGIVKEEKTRYVADKLLFRETTELIETSVTGERP